MYIYMEIFMKLIAMFASWEVTRRLGWQRNLFFSYLSFCIFEFCSMSMHHLLANVSLKIPLNSFLNLPTYDRSLFNL